MLNTLKIKKYKPGTGLSIIQYNNLENAIWKHEVTPDVYSSEVLIGAIHDYVKDLNSPTQRNKHSAILSDIKKAPKLRSYRVYDYQPGTGQGSVQFYKFAKAISEKNVDKQKLTTEKIFKIILNYVFDQIE